MDMAQSALEIALSKRRRLKNWKKLFQRDLNNYYTLSSEISGLFQKAL
jgi:hypothetical protein